MILAEIFMNFFRSLRRFFTPRFREVEYIALGEPIRRPGGEGDGMLEFVVRRPTYREMKEGREIFFSLLKFWCTPFTNNPGNLPVPDRVKELEDLSHSPERSVKFKQYVATVGSLNGAVYLALEELKKQDSNFMLNFVENERRDMWSLSDLISGNMASVCHGPMPELRVLHDYTHKWRRKLLSSERRDF